MSATIGASNSRMLAIARQIQDTFSKDGEHELRIEAEDEHGNWSSLVFNSEDTDRPDWNDDCVIVEAEDD